jgi:type IV secretory pathway VirB4 component
MAIKARATQEFVPIQEVRDGVVVMKDGSMRAIIIASSLNFSLKSEDEKTAVLLQFQDFLNSLDFSIQIFVESRRLDIRPYLALLEEQKKVQTNDLMKIQVEEYISFVRTFTENNNIMTKSFFVVIPYSPAMIQGKTGPISGLLGKKDTLTKKDSDGLAFEENRTQLEQRLSVVEQGLIRCGVRVQRLGNDEVIELFYKLFNPGETERPIVQE